MTWIPLLLVAAACGTTTTYENDEKARADVTAALDYSTRGPAVLLAGDRLYYIQKGALDPEIGAVLSALSTEIAKPANAQLQETVRGRGGEVVAFAYPSHQLELATDRGDLTLFRARLDSGTRYWAVAPQDEGRVVYAGAAGTRELDGAWKKLVSSAVKTVGSAREPSGMLYSSMFHPGRHMFLRDIGVDYRGLQGDATYSEK